MSSKPSSSPALLSVSFEPGIATLPDSSTRASSPSKHCPRLIFFLLYLVVRDEPTAEDTVSRGTSAVDTPAAALLRVLVPGFTSAWLSSLSKGCSFLLLFLRYLVVFVSDLSALGARARSAREHSADKSETTEGP